MNKTEKQFKNWGKIRTNGKKKFILEILIPLVIFTGLMQIAAYVYSNDKLITFSIFIPSCIVILIISYIAVQILWNKSEAKYQKDKVENQNLVKSMNRKDIDPDFFVDASRSSQGIMIEEKKEEHKRFSVTYDLTAKILQIICFSIFGLIFVIFAYVWISAFIQGAVPNQWGEFEGNHGPWRRAYDLRRCLHFLFLTCFISFFSGLLAFCFKPKWVTGIITVLSPILLYLFLATHFWLID